MTRPDFLSHLKITELGVCDQCGRPVNHDAMRFYVLRASMVVLDQQAARSTIGLSMHFGGHHALAEAMSPQPRAYKIVGVHDAAGWQSIFICAECGDGLTRAEDFQPAPLGHLMETADAHERRGE